MGARRNLAWLVIGAVFGVGLAVVTPPFQSPDEWLHLFAARQAASLRFLPDTEGDSLLTFSTPMERDLVALAARARQWGLPHHPERKVELREVMVCWDMPADLELVDVDALRFGRSPGIYAPTGYVAPGVALAVGRALHAPPGPRFLLARLANLAAYLLVVLLACRIAPGLRPLLTAFALVPMALASAATLSGDVTLLGSALVLLALVVRGCDGERALNGRLALAFAASALLLALSKGVYAPLLAVWLVVPSAASGGRGRHLALGGSVLAVAVAMVWGWSQVGGHGLRLAAAMVGIPAEANAAFLASHPLHLIAATARSVLRTDVAAGVTGRLGWLDVELPLTAHVAALAALACGAALVELPPLPRAARVRLALAIFVCCAVGVLGLGVLYGVYGYPLGAPSYGPSIQGRHLLPLVPWVLCGVRFLLPRPLSLTTEARHRLLLLGSLSGGVALLWALLAVVGRYYP